MASYRTYVRTEPTSARPTSSRSLLRIAPFVRRAGREDDAEHEFAPSVDLRQESAWSNQSVPPCSDPPATPRQAVAGAALGRSRSASCPVVRVQR
jgi:hypothetical protein